MLELHFPKMSALEMSRLLQSPFQCVDYAEDPDITDVVGLPRERRVLIKSMPGGFLCTRETWIL